MRFNFTDSNPTLFNLEGKAFYGKLVFVAPGTSKTYRNVFDVDGNNLGHVVYTNQYGRLTKQVILDGTYDVQYWEFTGTVFDAEDDTQWTLIRTDRIIDPEDNITVSVDGVMSFETMNALRSYNADGLIQGQTCLRTGYYVGGDHEPLSYRWEASVTSADDGGYIIAPYGRTSAGRWVATFPERINVKWFGVKSSSLQSQVTYQSSALIAAKNRSNIMGKTLYFPATSGNTFYGIDSVDLDVGNADIRMDAGVRIVEKSGTVNRLKCYNLYCDRDEKVFLNSSNNTYCGITAHEVWTATVDNYGAVKADIVHWNAAVRQSNWKDCEIVFETEPSNTMGFERCTLSFASDDYRFEDERSYTFIDMVFTDKYFKEDDVDYGYVSVRKNCEVDLESFKKANNWFMLQQDWGITSINCQGKYMDALTLDFDCSLHNVNIGVLTVVAGHALDINVGHVDGIVFNDSGKAVTMTELTIGGNSKSTSINCASLKCRSVIIEYASAAINCTSFDADRSEFKCAISTNAFTATHSDFVSTVTCKNFAATYSTFASTINVLFLYSIQVVCIGCTIGANSTMQIARHSSSSATSVTALNCQWIGNNIQNKNFWIVLDRTYVNSNDAAHSYVYENNYGACPQPGKPIVYGIKTVLGYDSNPSTRDQPFSGMYMSYEDFGEYGGKHIYSSVWNVWGNPFKDIFIFSIGTYNVSAYIDVEFIGFGVKYGTEEKMYDVPAVKLGSGYSWSFFVSDTDKVLLSTDTEGSSVTASQLQFVTAYNWRLHTNHLDNKYLPASPKSVNAWRGSPMQYLDINSFNGGLVQYTKETWPNVTGYWKLTARKK